VDRAYSLITIKSVDFERRTFAGVATTPTPDDSGDIIDPLGVSFRNPLPLLLHHDRKMPVGQATFSDPTPSGINFEATIPEITEPGIVKSRVDEAWHSVKAGLIRGVSVGIKALKENVQQAKSGGLHFLKSEVFELSLVTIPANMEATITTVKSLDLAATGRHSPGDAGTLPVVRAVKAAPAMSTVAEQITNFTNTRAAKSARMVALMTTTEGQTLDAPQREEYDTLKGEVTAIDEHLVRLNDLEKMNLKAATAITTTTSQVTASELRGGNSVVTVKANVDKGTAFTRFIMAKASSKGSISDAIRIVESNKVWMDQTPEVLLALKAAVNPGTIAEPAWAAPLAVQSPMAQEFLDLLRPATLIGKIPNFKRIPFNVSFPMQTGGGTYAWVGEGAPKPVGNLQFVSVTLGIAKSAGIIVISEELARLSSPSAEATVRNDMIRGMSTFLDQQFIDPTVAAVTNVSPASITNLANGYATAGTSADNARTDLKKGITLMTANNYPLSELVFIMSEANAFALSMALTANGVLVNPNLGSLGGTIFGGPTGGVPVITSQSAGSVVATVHAPSIAYADEGGINIDVSREASVEMNTTPTSPVTASSAYVSLWQANLVGLRAERFINWKRARTTGVVYTTATYV
jgi:HK97 family phage major capsid protein/HK97 family phage prohead protease